MATRTKRRTKTREQTKDFNKGKSHAISVLGQQYTDGYRAGFNAGWRAGRDHVMAMRRQQIGRPIIDLLIRQIYRDKRHRGERLHLLEDARYWNDEVLWPQEWRAEFKRRDSTARFWATFVDGRTVGW